MAARMDGYELWVVYRMLIKGSADGVNAVCSESEWAEMEQSRPGQHILLRSGIKSEAEAEKLARGTSGDTIPRGAVRPAAGPAAVATS
jgi:hypothetical protein